MRLQGHAHALGSIFAFVCRRNDAVDQGQVRNPLRQRPGDDQRSDRPHGVPHQRKTLQAQLFGDLQHIMGVVPHRVAGTRRAMPGMTVTGHVQRDDAQPFELRRQPGKAVGVVQPAVQGNHRQTVFGAEQVRRQLNVRQAQADFFDGMVHAQSC
ncbi:hypothetical protein D3C84_895160 [compost metagenome]